MKLNYKKTIYVGLAFFLICAFWQAYETIIPKILTDKFGMSQTISGLIMALDNIVALFMLPLFGAISDRRNSRLGRRTPFIIIGTVLALVLFLPLSYADHLQLGNLADITGDREQSLSAVWEADPEIRDPDSGDTVKLSSLFESKEAFTSIPSTVSSGGKQVTNPDHTDYVIPARQAYARAMTLENPGPLIFFMATLFLLLLAMSVFRSPAVALMPDVTVKPLRSKANAVINLMGAVGGILTLVLGILLGTGNVDNALMPHTVFFLSVGAIMLVSLAVFLWKVREPKLVAEMKAESAQLGVSDEPETEEEIAAELARGRKPGHGAMISMIFILLSVIFWYMGYNAVSSKYSVYASSVLGLDYNITLILAQGVAIVSFIPLGHLSSRFGRKRTVIAGVLLLTLSLSVISFLRAGSPLFMVNLLFSLGGIGWAAINVNSFPMVVELCHEGNVGKYTGYYYTASMAAQTLTPVLSGLFLDEIGMTALFPYAAICMAVAFVTMLFVRHGEAHTAQTPEKEA